MEEEIITIAPIINTHSLIDRQLIQRNEDLDNVQFIYRLFKDHIIQGNGLVKRSENYFHMVSSLDLGLKKLEHLQENVNVHHLIFRERAQKTDTSSTISLLSLMFRFHDTSDIYRIDILDEESLIFVSLEGNKQCSIPLKDFTERFLRTYCVQGALHNVFRYQTDLEDYKKIRANLKLTEMLFVAEHDETLLRVDTLINRRRSRAIEVPMEPVVTSMFDPELDEEIRVSLNRIGSEGYIHFSGTTPTKKKKLDPNKEYTTKQLFNSRAVAVIALKNYHDILTKGVAYQLLDNVRITTNFNYSINASKMKFKVCD